MIKNRSTLFIGIFILIIFFLGFPSSWERFFVIISGIYLILTSIKISLPRRGTAKKIRRKEKSTPVFVENSPMPTTKIEDIVPPKEPTIES